MKARRPLLDHLNLSTLKLIAAIEREGSLSRAAATLHIVPSAASRRITQLEAAMGSALLDRTARGVELTAAGLSVARYARAMIDDVEALDDELQNLQAGVSGRIRLVASISAIVQHLPQDLALFLHQHPSIKIELAEHTSADIVELLLQDRADVGVFVAEGDIPGLTLQPYRSERLVVIRPAGHRFAKRKRLRFDQLLEEEWVELPPGTALAMRVAKEALKHGVKLRTRIQVKGMDSCSRMVQCGLGIGLLPQASLEQQAQFPNLAFVPLDEPWAHRVSSLAVSAHSQPTPASRTLLQALMYASKLPG
ncbi:LysR family transcriptional regulator [Variovorax sp. J31P179]|uniref:LysR family transcriptional regulator n=1 Tax=Variovorax sp. J31P179 TaxID=3053508 RepID=UPI002578918A|nr:LysR family transcriptional regulator [Variovorax sp. J31P179]MDM0079189.1 LysR family transcriptional regulator [Variovorax sp. J31P179]